MTSTVPVKAERSGNSVARSPFSSLRQEIDRLIEDFDGGLWPRSFHRGWLAAPYFSRSTTVAITPAVDVAEKDNAFEITAELPGMDEKDIEVKLTNGGLQIHGEKKAEKEEKRKDYYLSERSYGSFDRYFGLPEGIAADKISASFKNGVLTVTLPKTAEYRKNEKNIPVKAG
jgi:HSP20 family protein